MAKFVSIRANSGYIHSFNMEHVVRISQYSEHIVIEGDRNSADANTITVGKNYTAKSIVDFLLEALPKQPIHQGLIDLANEEGRN